MLHLKSNRPDINALRDRQALVNTAPNTNQLTTLTFQQPALEDLEAPRRQTSLDGEAIKIIIHDVDSGPFFAAKRRVTLRRDPTDKAHRSIIYIEFIHAFLSHFRIFIYLHNPFFGVVYAIFSRHTHVTFQMNISHSHKAFSRTRL